MEHPLHYAIDYDLKVILIQFTYAKNTNQY